MDIGIWGDSITYGEWDSEALGWVGRLRKSMPDSEVYNHGICSDTTTRLLKRFSTEAASRSLEMVVFAIGINDSRYPVGKTESETPMEEFRKNLSLLIAQARQYADNIKLVGTTRIDDALVAAWDTPFFNKEIEKYNEALKEIATEENVPFIDVLDVLNPATDLADGLHPNAQGYDKLFQTIAAHLK